MKTHTIYKRLLMAFVSLLVSAACAEAQAPRGKVAHVSPTIQRQQASAENAQSQTTPQENIATDRDKEVDGQVRKLQNGPHATGGNKPAGRRYARTQPKINR
jgi:hypothetical protein